MPENSKPPRTRLPKRQALKLLQAGLTQTETAKRLGVSRCTVNRFVQTLAGELEQVERYRTLWNVGLTKVQLLSQQRQVEILSDDGIFNRLGDDSKIKALFALNTTYGTAFDKERLEAGKSTNNVDLAGLVTHVHEHGLFTKKELTAGRSVPSGNAQGHQSGTPAPQCYSELPHNVTDDS